MHNVESIRQTIFAVVGGDRSGTTGYDDRGCDGPIVYQTQRHLLGWFDRTA